MSCSCTSRVPRVTLASISSIAIVVSSACGGRTQLVPAYQIGRLSSDAVVSSDAGVRVMARTAAWPDPRVDFERFFPIELTFDNGSARELSVRSGHVSLVTNAGLRMPAIPAATLGETLAGTLSMLPPGALEERALVEGPLPPGGRRTGFLYFERPDDAEELDLTIDLVSAGPGGQFGTIVMPFILD